MDPDAASRPVGVLYTGGTFGMRPSRRGLVPSTDLPERVERALAENELDPPPRFAWLDPGLEPLASSDLAPPAWYRIAERIADAAAEHAGFVVIHGTDTLAYTGSALSFLLADLATPVVVTGARAPLGEAGSDALDNLRNALHEARRPAPGVRVAFGGAVLRANRSTKRHGVPDHPFCSPCAEPLTGIGEAAGQAPGGAVAGQGPGRSLTPVHDPADVRVAVLPAYPGIDGAMVRAVTRSAPHGLVLEGYAAGIGPGGDPGFVAALGEAVGAGTVVGAISQSRSGRVTLGKYASSTPLADAGVVGGADMTREAALAKLHVLRTAGLGPEEAGAAFAEDLCGELTPEP